MNDSSALVGTGLDRFVGPQQAEGWEVAALLGGSAQDPDIVAAPREAGNLGAAHPPRSDGSDFHRGYPINSSVASAASSTVPPWVAAVSARSATSRTSFCSSQPA